MGNSGVGVKVVMARNRSGTSERRVGTRSQAQNNQQNNGEATPVVEIEENVLASTTSLVSTTSTSSSTSVESLISPVVPSELAHIPKKLLDEFLHECFFGVIQEKRRGENNVDRVYKCKDCSFSMNVGDADVRKHNRLSHIKNAHKNHYMSDLLVFVRRRYGESTGDALAEAALTAGYTLTGDVRRDQASLLFILACRTNVPFSFVEDPVFRVIAGSFLNHSADNVSNAGQGLLSSLQQTIAQRLPHSIGLLFDCWSGPHGKMLAVMSVCGINGSPQYELLALRTVLPITPQSDESTFEERMQLIEALGTDERTPRLEVDNGDESGEESGDDDAVFLDETDFAADADVYAGMIQDILFDYGKELGHVAFLVADNEPLNRSIASKLRKPLIGCHAHLFNLAQKQYFDKHANVIKGLFSLMQHARNTPAIRKLVKAETGSIPKKSCTTRWRSVFAMMISYVKSREALQHCTGHMTMRLMPSMEAEQKIRAMLIDFDHVLEESINFIDREHVPLLDARELFDGLRLVGILDGRKNYLTLAGAPFTRKGKEFIESVMNANSDVVLSAEEKRMLRCFELRAKSKSQQPQFIARMHADSDAAGQTTYDFDWLPATTSILERVFSVLKQFCIDNRQSLKAETLEALLMLRFYAPENNSKRMPLSNPRDVESLTNSVVNLSL